MRSEEERVGRFESLTIVDILPTAPAVQRNQHCAFQILTANEQLVLVAEDEWMKDCWVLALEQLLEKS
jgi:hypothetical protein